MRVLVTGGAGYIGSVIVARLVARGHQVTVYDDLSRGHAAAVHPAARLLRGDVRDAAAMRAALAGSGADAVVHMAALAEVSESVARPDLYHDVNANGSAALASAAAAAGVRGVVYSSTAAVYGEPRRTPIEEGDALAPSNPYGESKLAGERLLAAAGLPMVALRYFNACGADGGLGEDHRPETHLVPLALRAAQTGGDVRVFGTDYPTPDGTCVRDYVHVADLAEAHILALERLPDLTGAFNLGTGCGDSVLTVLDTVEAVTGLGLRRVMTARRPGDPPALVASNRRAAAELGWRPRRSLADAVRDAWEWLQAHPSGYGDGVGD